MITVFEFDNKKIVVNTNDLHDASQKFMKSYKEKDWTDCHVVINNDGIITFDFPDHSIDIETTIYEDGIIIN